MLPDRGERGVNDKSKTGTESPANRAHLRRCLELQPDAKIRDDAKDLLSTIIKEDVE